MVTLTVTKASGHSVTRFSFSKLTGSFKYYNNNNNNNLELCRRLKPFLSFPLEPDLKLVAGDRSVEFGPYFLTGILAFFRHYLIQPLVSLELEQVEGAEAGLRADVIWRWSSLAAKELKSSLRALHIVNTAASICSF